MPSALRIRKEILNALEESIIPVLWSQQVALGYVVPPLEMHGEIDKYLLDATLPAPDMESPGFPIQTVWPSAKLHSTTHPYLSFIYEGSAQERTLINAAQASQHNIGHGVYGIRWHAPSVLFFPSGTPRNTGACQFLQNGITSCNARLKILQMAIRDTILIHIHTEPTLDEGANHSLQIEDASLLVIARIFRDELQNAQTAHQQAAQAALLLLMLRLRNKLSAHLPCLANTAYPKVIPTALVRKQSEYLHQKIIQFIQTHLHEHLTLPQIAREVGFSPTHLNRLFRQSNGISVMRYVKLQRIEAAKNILQYGTENITEIAALVGFGSSTVFCRVFLCETGMTPTQYRRQMRQINSTF